MKIVLAIVVSIVIGLAAVFVLEIPEEGPIFVDPKNVVTKKINMSGMTCEECEIAIEKTQGSNGIVKVKASSPNQTAIVEYDKTQTNIDEVIKVIAKRGFPPVSYEDEEGLHDLNGSKIEMGKDEMGKDEMKCGAGKCGAGKCGGSK